LTLTKTTNPNARCYYLTPDRFFLGLLAVQVFLLLSEWFQWFAFNEHKGWTVLIALGVVLVALLVVLIWGLGCFFRRRRFQFSYRSLLVFLVALSVPLGWFAWEIQRARKQRAAVDNIAKAGGWVAYDFHWNESGMPVQPPGPSWLRELLGDDFFSDVVGARVIGTPAGDAELEHIKGLADLRYVNLTGTNVTNEGVKNLQAALPNCEIYH
jgi:hypothetical protein